MLKNLFPQGNNMAVGYSSGNTQGETQSVSFIEDNMSFINMVRLDINVLTRTWDYGNPESTSKGKENFHFEKSLYIVKPGGIQCHTYQKACISIIPTKLMLKLHPTI